MAINSYGVPATRMTYASCKWERVLSRMFDEGLKSMEISLRETGHSSINSMRTNCQAALKRLGKGTMYTVGKTNNGIVVTKAY